MNLSPTWLSVFAEAGWEAYHWSSVGEHSAPDGEILRWAADNGCIVFTHDLDFGALLASTGYRIPSVVQLRGHETSPSKMATQSSLLLKRSPKNWKLEPLSPLTPPERGPEFCLLYALEMTKLKRWASASFNSLPNSTGCWAQPASPAGASGRNSAGKPRCVAPRHRRSTGS